MIFSVSGVRGRLRRRGGVIFRNAIACGVGCLTSYCFVMNEVFWGFGEVCRYHPDQKNEIYNFGVVQDLQISKKLEL